MALYIATQQYFCSLTRYRYYWEAPFSWDKKETTFSVILECYPMIHSCNSLSKDIRMWGFRGDKYLMNLKLQ